MYVHTIGAESYKPHATDDELLYDVRPLGIAVTALLSKAVEQQPYASCFLQYS